MDDDVARLARRVREVAVEVGQDRWPELLRGRKRTEFQRSNEEDEEEAQEPPPEDWELLCGPLSMSLEEAWALMPRIHEMAGDVVNPEEEENMREWIDELYVDAKSGKEAAKEERIQRKLFDEVYSHAETDVVFVANIFWKLRRIFGHIKVPNTGIFVDCGSSRGKNVYVAALLHSWQRCLGIDILQSLTDVAEGLTARFDDVTCSYLTQHQQDERDSSPESLQFLCADIFASTEILIPASFVYADLTCIPLEALTRFKALLNDLAPAAIVVTLTRPLDDDCFILLWKDHRAPTTWGVTTAYVYERKP